MKIVVPVKCVAGLDDEFELTNDGSAVDPAGLEWDLNEWDAFSLEAACQLRDASGDGEVLAVTVGDEQADETLLGALARGADRGVRIWDDELVDADALSVARVLAASIAPESPDLVLCGVQSSDAANGATGIALAGLLDLAHVAVVTAFRVTGSKIEAERELEGGLVELVTLELPALLTVQTGINEPRYATLRAIKQAREKPVQRVGLTEIGLSSEDVKIAAGSRRTRLAAPERASTAELLNGSAADVAEQILNLVKAQVG